LLEASFVASLFKLTASGDLGGYLLRRRYPNDRWWRLSERCWRAGSVDSDIIGKNVILSA